MKTPPWQRDPARYDFRHTVALQYSHLDTIRHLNNVAAHGLHLEARTRYQMELLGDDSLFSDDVLLRPRRTVTHFLRETHFPHDVTVAARLLAVARDDYRIATAVFQHGECVGVQDSWMGAWHDGAFTALPEPVRDALERRLDAIEAVTTTPSPEPPHARIPVADYPKTAPLTGRYGDLDPDSVIGELALARYVEQARAGALRPIRRASSFGMLVASVDISYPRWHHGFADAALGCGIDRIGNSSFSLASAIAVDREPLANARTTMVVIDREKRRPTPIDHSLRETMAALFITADADDNPAAAASCGNG